MLPLLGLLLALAVLIPIALRLRHACALSKELEKADDADKTKLIELVRPGLEPPLLKMGLEWSDDVIAPSAATVVRQVAQALQHLHRRVRPPVSTP